jgi:signal transduction histidine kinase
MQRNKHSSWQELRLNLGRKLLCVWSLWLWSTCIGSGAGTLTLHENTTKVELAPYLSLFHDPSGRMGLDEVKQVWAKGGFEPVTGLRPTLGFTTDAVWLRFELRHGGTNPREWFVELMTSRMDSVEFHLIRSSGRVDKWEAGNAVADTTQGPHSSYPVFPLSLVAGEQAECFVRVRSETSLQLPLRVVGAMALANSGQRVFVMACLGYLLALIALSFGFWRAVRESGFLSYALSLCGTLVAYMILSGYWKWLGLPGGMFTLKQGLIIAGELSIFMMIAFVRYLFDPEKLMPRLDRCVLVAQWAGVAFAVLLICLPYRAAYPIFVGHMLAVGLSSMLLALFAWRRGDRVAPTYLLAWIVFWACYWTSGLCFLAKQPLPHLLWVYALLGYCISATLFLVAIADKVSQIRQAALAAQERVAAQEREASEELRQQSHREQLLIRDLHDGIGGLTANLAILAEIGRRDATAEPERERFARITQMATHGGAEVRSLMGVLEARDMSWTDFFDECRSYGQMTVEAHGIEFRLEENSDLCQAGPMVFSGLSLLRVVKEAMTNAVKHAACSKVKLEAKFSPDHLRLTICDNGIGFTSPAHREGRGQRNMAARIRELGGTMSCRGEQGVELVFELPLPLKLWVSLPEIPN